MQSAQLCTIYVVIVSPLSVTNACSMLLYPQVCKYIWDLLIDTSLRWIIKNSKDNLIHILLFYSDKSLYQVMATEYHVKSTLALPRKIEMS